MEGVFLVKGGGDLSLSQILLGALDPLFSYLGNVSLPLRIRICHKFDSISMAYEMIDAGKSNCDVFPQKVLITRCRIESDGKALEWLLVHGLELLVETRRATEVKHGRNRWR